MAPQQRGILFHILDVFFNIVVIVAIVAGIRTFLVSPFQVEGSSMDDTLEDRQYIIINKLAFLIGSPERGDVVVFNPPTGDHRKYYVKRVIGLPGDAVIIKNGYVYLRKAGEEEVRKLDEEYLNDRNLGNTYRHPPSSGDKSQAEFVVAPNAYFLLGDNRMGSLDSRSFTERETGEPSPFVAEKDIKGRVWFVALPVTKIHALSPPEYGF
ncbi:MAG: signal peptidase I [Candidatus Peregrinibacteria bacterium Greene0416_19]|nr:MAG: signal peptidase I [Candidatus Peregrinibacteria bacterium Greene0416_19]